MLQRMLWGTMLLAAAACGSDDDRDGAGGGGGGGEGGCLQMPACTSSIAPAKAICVEDECLAVGARTEPGDPIRSSMRALVSYPSDVVNFEVNALGLTVFHPITPLGGTLDCETLLALDLDERRNAGHTNAVLQAGVSTDFVSGNDFVSSPLGPIPVNDPGVAYLLLAEFHTGGRDSTTGFARGAVIADGCIAGLVAPAGRYTENQDDQRFTVQVSLKMR